MKHSLTSLPPGYVSLVDLVSGALGGGSPPVPADERSSALKPTLLERLERALWRSRQREVERMLEGATDAADVEEKLRRLEWRMLRRHY